MLDLLKIAAVECVYIANNQQDLFDGNNHNRSFQFD